MANLDETTIDAKVSTEELDSAKAEIAEELDDDAVPNGEFEVTKEEMSIIRAELACEFPDDYEYLRLVCCTIFLVCCLFVECFLLLLLLLLVNHHAHLMHQHARVLLSPTATPMSNQ
jgi:hypothetical protein